MLSNTVEVDIKYNSWNFTQEQYFILNKDITVCSCKAGTWGNPIEYKTDETDREILKQIIQCFKEGVNFREYGTPVYVKIWNLSRL